MFSIFNSFNWRQHWRRYVDFFSKFSSLPNYQTLLTEFHANKLKDNHINQFNDNNTVTYGADIERVKCSIHCVLCERNGECLGCEVGYYGSTCTFKCLVYCGLKGCKQNTGTCNGMLHIFSFIVIELQKTKQMDTIANETTLHPIPHVYPGKKCIVNGHLKYLKLHWWRSGYKI